MATAAPAVNEDIVNHSTDPAATKRYVAIVPSQWQVCCLACARTSHHQVFASWHLPGPRGYSRVTRATVATSYTRFAGALSPNSLAHKAMWMRLKKIRN